MFHENYLKDINKKLFRFQQKNIKNTKKGDTVIYRGGTFIDTGEKVKSKSFLIGKKYITSSDYRANSNKEGAIWFTDHLNDHDENGHISVEKDSNGHQNGWNAALFELI